MTIRNLDKLLNPASVAVIGASDRQGSIGGMLARNLATGNFSGKLWGVNPNHAEVHGIPCFASVEELPEAPDLAVIATPIATAPGLIAQLGARGTRAAIVISAAREDESGTALKAELLQAARPHLMRIVGPNCLGVMAPSIGLNASFAHLPPLAGKLAFVTQSGAIVTAMIDWAQSRDIGFSHVVSLGDMSDVDFGDMLDFLANDPATDAILLYIEAVTGARKFVSAARAAARTKPVIVVKGGRFAAGARAAATHTGAMMGRDAVYDAVFRRTGMVRVYTLRELFSAAETLGRVPRLRGERLAILTNGGGMAVLAADALAARDGTLATLGEATVEALDALLPPNWSRTNPVDIIGDADATRFARAASVLAADSRIDALLVIHCPTAVCPGIDAAEAILAALKGLKRPPLLLTSWVGGTAAQRAREIFSEAGVASFPTPEEAVWGFMHAVNHGRGQRILMETPESAPPLRAPALAQATAIVNAAVAAGRQWLDPDETRAVLCDYRFEVVGAEFAATAEEAGAAADRLGKAVALKIASPDITHKTDAGGVVLDLVGAQSVCAAASAMRDSILARTPQARIEGFRVEPMVHKSGAYELILGMSTDPQFGPVLVFGHGGTATETIDDRALALPPLNMHLARSMIARTRIARLLEGARGMAAANMDAIALALVNLSQLVCDIPGILELDINPLLADEHGAIVLDARIRVGQGAASGTDRLAIKPYPRELEEDVRLADGQVLWLRPIRPEDEPSLQRGFRSLTPQEVYMRFFAPLKALSHAMAARFTQIDYDRQMALILTDHGAPGTTEYYGSVTIICDPDMQRAEYAILVRHDMTGKGLGSLLMRRIIAYARSRGLQEIFGEVLAQNHAMLKLCRALGFRLQTNPRDPSVITVRLSLADNTAAPDDAAPFASRSP